MKDEKYVVLKRSDWEAISETYATDSGGDITCEAEPLDDAVVIRLGDAFAAVGLMAYANAVEAGIETLKIVGLLKPVQKQLRHIADYFHDCANEASKHDSHFPD